MALYLRSIFYELQVPQPFTTVTYEDDRGALLTASAAQPTKQSRHIDIREYAILDLVERDLITLANVASGLTTSDVITKQTGGILFARHVNNLTGRLPPPYIHYHVPVPDLLLWVLFLSLCITLSIVVFADVLQARGGLSMSVSLAVYLTYHISHSL